MGKLAKVKLNCYLDINAYLKIVKLKKKDRDWKRLEKSKAILGNFLFLVTRLSSVAQAPLLQIKREVVKRLLILYPK